MSAEEVRWLQEECARLEQKLALSQAQLTKRLEALDAELGCIKSEEIKTVRKLDRLDSYIVTQERKGRLSERDIEVEKLVAKVLQQDIEQISFDVKTQKKKQRDLKKRVRELKTQQEEKKIDLHGLHGRINGEIDGVYSNLLTAQDSSGLRQVKREKMKRMIGVEYDRFYSRFKNWRYAWPTLHVWQSAESEMVAAINSVASLQGLTSEWKSLVGLPCHSNHKNGPLE